MTLTQEDGETILEYEDKFTWLAQFSPHLLENSYDNIEKFQYGLKSNIRRALAALDFITYESLVRCALKVETEHQDYLNMKEKQADKKRKIEYQTGGLGSKKLEIKGPEKRSICSKCGKEHRGQCLQGTKICFKCGGNGHIARDCVTTSRKVNNLPQMRNPLPMPKQSETEHPGVRCYNCNEMGHYANVCHKPRNMRGNRPQSQGQQQIPR